MNTPGKGKTLNIVGLILISIMGIAVYQCAELFFENESEWPEKIRLMVFGLLLVVLLTLQFISNQAKPLTYLLVISFFIPLYGFDIYFSLPKSKQRFDSRSKYEVVMDIRITGQQAYPAIHPYYFYKKPLKLGGQKIIPLGGIPSVKTVLCSENGPYIIYHSDQFGFHNPPGIWKLPIKVALLGDSFTQGFCVSSNNHFSAIIRSHYPGTLNLGGAGNGPLVEFAAIREYLSIKKPKYVLWFYYEGNDFLLHKVKTISERSDFFRESRHSLWMRYLDPNFKQGLIAKNREIRAGLIDFIEKKIQKKTIGVAYKDSADMRWKIIKKQFTYLSRILSLQHTLEFIKDYPWRVEAEVQKRHIEALSLLPLYKDILLLAQKEVTSWGGHLIMVYLPNNRTVLRLKIHPFKDEVFNIWEELGLDFINAIPAFQKHPNKQRLFYRHYSEAGYALVADTILERLNSYEKMRRESEK